MFCFQILSQRTRSLQVCSTFREGIRCTNKKLEDSSNMVNPGYAAMIKLENELLKQGQCMFE